MAVTIDIVNPTSAAARLRRAPRPDHVEPACSHSSVIDDGVTIGHSCSHASQSRGAKCDQTRSTTRAAVVSSRRAGRLS